MQFPFVVRLGNSGLWVSKIILGCMSYGSSDWQEWVLGEEEGIKHIKMACVPQHSEPQAAESCVGMTQESIHLTQQMQVDNFHTHTTLLQAARSIHVEPLKWSLEKLSSNSNFLGTRLLWWPRSESFAPPYCYEIFMYYSSVILAPQRRSQRAIRT